MNTGAILSNIDVRDYKGICSTPLKEIPKEFELPIIRIKDQKQVNSCVAHALSSVIEYYNYVQYGLKNEMSVGYIYGNREESNHKDKGMIVRDALSTVCKYGDVKKTIFPYNIEVPEAIDKFQIYKESLYEEGYPNRFSSYCKLNNAKDIKASLMSNCPVVFAMNWYDDIEVVDGIIKTTSKSSNGAHCMIIYGWNKEGWKIQNSWGKTWGNKGTAILPFDIKINEAWSVIDNITDNLKIKKPFPSKIGKIVAKLLNWILNLINNRK